MSKRWPAKVIIGLTGNIATGKSAVMRMAAERGALTLDADNIVHAILDGDPSMQAAIAVAFGEHLRRRDGSIDRAALGAIVFEDPAALRDLEMLVHPAVRLEVVRRIEASDTPVVMVEAIKLLEGEIAELCDQVWVTRCPRGVQMQRLLVCRGMDEEAAMARIDAQDPQEAKVARADVVIDTEGLMAETKEQVDRAWERLQDLFPGAAGDASQHESTAWARSQQRPASKASPEAQPVRAAPVEKGELSRKPRLEGAAGVLVRRARPSDIPSLLLLMQRASGGTIKLTRAEMLASFSERSYLIAQIDADVVGVVGWNTDSTTAVCVDQIFAHPVKTIRLSGPVLLQEIERSARTLICEVVLVFLAQDAPALFEQWLREAGYERMIPDDMRRAWRQTVAERQPPGTVIMGKVLRDVRVA